MDKAGQTVNIFLSQNRDVNTAKTFLRNAMNNRSIPLRSRWTRHRIAMRQMRKTGELPRRVKVRSSEYLNNLVEQNHSPFGAMCTASGLFCIGLLDPLALPEKLDDSPSWCPHDQRLRTIQFP